MNDRVIATYRVIKHDVCTTCAYELEQVHLCAPIVHHKRCNSTYLKKINTLIKKLIGIKIYSKFDSECLFKDIV